MQPTPAATRLVCAWVRAALRAEVGSDPGPVPATAEAGRVPEAVRAEDVLRAVVRQRVVELLHDRSAELGLPADLVARLEALRTPGRRQVHVQLLEMQRVHELLDGAGIRHLFFKGPALAVQTTWDPGARGPGDIDLLVSPEDADTAFGLLAGAGWTPSEHEPPPGSWAWRRLRYVYCAATLLGPTGALDLHWRLDPTLDALPGFDDLWARRESVDLPGGSVTTLGRRDALAHACLHAAKDEWRWLRSLVDVHRLTRSTGVLDGFEPSRLARTTLAVTDELIGLPDGVAARLVAPPATGPDAQTVQEAVARARAGGVTSRWLVRYQLAASSTPRDVRRMLAGLVTPADQLGGIKGRTAWTGVPHALGRRVHRLLLRRVTAS